jgi:hypothetical protein
MEESKKLIVTESCACVCACARACMCVSAHAIVRERGIDFLALKRISEILMLM